MKNKKYINILNVIAIIAVIAMHCNGIVHHYSEERSWATSLIIECICYWAVPIFLMITGANLFEYRKKYNTKTFFEKRLKKIVIPLVFWSIIMSIIYIYKQNILLKDIKLVDFINIIMTNEEQPIYYYLFVMIGIYMTLPLLSHLSEDKYRKTLWYIILVCFIFNCTLPVIFNIFGIIYNWDMSVQIGGYLIYVILGFLLSKQDIDKKNRLVIYSFGILSVLFRYIYTYFYSRFNHVLVIDLFGYTQFHSVLLSTSIFVFIKNINWDKIFKSERMFSIIEVISSYSFGVYLIHMLIVDIQIALININTSSWEWRTLGILSTYLLSLISVYFLKKIKILRYIVP